MLRHLGLSQNGMSSRVKVTAQVNNTETKVDLETIQVCIKSPIVNDIDKPVRGLVEVAKMELKPGEEKTIEIEFSRDGAAYCEETKKGWAVNQGMYVVLVATSSSSKDTKARLDAHVNQELTFRP